MEEIKEKILAYLAGVSKEKPRSSYITLAGKDHTPGVAKEE